jgi:hypothetical protein
MRLWGQPVAANGNEIWVFEAVLGSKRSNRLRLAAPLFFHNLSILLPLCSGFLVRRSYEVVAEGGHGVRISR